MVLIHRVSRVAPRDRSFLLPNGFPQLMTPGPLHATRRRANPTQVILAPS